MIFHDFHELFSCFLFISCILLSTYGHTLLLSVMFCYVLHAGMQLGSSFGGWRWQGCTRLLDVVVGFLLGPIEHRGFFLYEFVEG